MAAYYQSISGIWTFVLVLPSYICIKEINVALCESADDVVVGRSVSRGEGAASGSLIGQSTTAGTISPVRVRYGVGVSRPSTDKEHLTTIASLLRPPAFCVD